MAARACRWASRSLASSDPSSFTLAKLLAISAWSTGSTPAACCWATGKRLAYAFGPASMSRSASRAGIVAGVVNQDGGGKAPFTLESAGVPEDARQGSQQSLPDGSQGLDQRRVITGILDRGCEELVGDERRDAVPAVLDLGGIGVGQGTGRAKAWLLVGFGIVQQGP